MRSLEELRNDLKNSKKGVINKLMAIVIGVVLVLVIGLFLFGIFSGMIVGNTDRYMSEFVDINATGSVLDTGMLTSAELTEAQGDFGQTAVNIPLILVAIVIIILLVAGIGLAIKSGKFGK